MIANLHPLRKKLRQSYKKNMPDLMAVIRRRHPEFVFEDRLQTLKEEVPVFNFHSVSPERFESQLRHLQSNRYRTLSADELTLILNREMPVPERGVVLTFDDGHVTLWSVAFPLLKRYGFKAVAFVIPAWTEGDAVERPNLESVWDGRAALEELLRAGNTRLFCNWRELKVMKQSGVVDIQSHSLNHARVFVSSKAVDFFCPNRDEIFLQYDLPVYRESGRDRWDRPGLIGMPIYENIPRLSKHIRYFDDEDLRQICIQHVAEHGGSAYFSRRESYRELFKIVRDYRQDHREQGRFETTQEREEALFQELEGSKRLIEEKLSGHRVKHFCYPWWSGSDQAVELSKKIGYATNFWGILPGRRTNRPGDDPYHIVRLLDDYIFRLPGDGRRSLMSVLSERFRAHGTKFTQQAIGESR
jgi:peptidoglycan/xylan/chitin deacetylase (PgdA/CDA1 family)